MSWEMGRQHFISTRCRVQHHFVPEYLWRVHRSLHTCHSQSSPSYSGHPRPRRPIQHTIDGSSRKAGLITRFHGVKLSGCSLLRIKPEFLDLAFRAAAFGLFRPPQPHPVRVRPRFLRSGCTLHTRGSFHAIPSFISSLLGGVVFTWIH